MQKQRLSNWRQLGQMTSNQFLFFFPFSTQAAAQERSKYFKCVRSSIAIGSKFFHARGWDRRKRQWSLIYCQCCLLDSWHFLRIFHMELGNMSCFVSFNVPSTKELFLLFFFWKIQQMKRSKLHSRTTTTKQNISLIRGGLIHHFPSVERKCFLCRQISVINSLHAVHINQHLGKIRLFVDAAYAFLSHHLSIY